GLPPCTAVLAGFKGLLSRHTGQDDVIVGCPVAGRTRPETEGLIGYFANTLPLRTDLGGDPPFRDLLRRVGESGNGAFTHQELPFAKLVPEGQPHLDPSPTPLFHVLFNL